MSPPRRERGTAKHEDMIGAHELTMATIAENRRSQARGSMLQAHNDNIELTRQKAQLEEENAELRETIKSVSSLARTSLIRSDALRKTVEHLRNAWKEDAPNSAQREEVDEGVPQFFRKTFDENCADIGLTETVEQEIAQARIQAKSTIRSRKPR